VKTLKIEASAPSNIALIKYMGKASLHGNLPANSSLSYTLSHLRSYVVLEESSCDEWTELLGFTPFHLGETGRTKFMNHFMKLKAAWEIKGQFQVRSANDFPADCGLASSASSFAALTLATYKLAQAQRPEFRLSDRELSLWSRQGSGSSCRSFFAPWALWKDEAAEEMQLDLRLDHAVVVVASETKLVSSSQAHQRVVSSLLFEKRGERAARRLEALVQALRDRYWSEAFEICWAEFWDMHALFETSQPSFGYLQSESIKILEALRRVWRESGDGPLVTMDAGPNIHVLIRPDQRQDADRWLQGLKVIRSWKS
jgi:diphosphomevalonate decarboxylase